MNATAALLTTLGGLVALLGTLWTVQGLGLVRIGPVLCVADCEPVTGPSVRWTLFGLVALTVGLGTVWAGRRRTGR